jgi:hypothetical protein
MPRFARSAAALVLAIPTFAWAQSNYDDDKTSAGWAWARIRADEIADFGERCGELDPHNKTGWDDPCRQIPPQFLIDMLTVPKWRDRLVRPRMRLRGAHITGTLDFTDAEISPEVWIDASRIEGSLILTDSHWERLLSVRGSVLRGEFSAWRMRSSNDVLLRDHAEIERDVSLGGANLGGNLEMESSLFRGAVHGNSMSLAGSLFMRDQASFEGHVDLTASKIGGSLDMSGSSFARGLSASRLNVGGSVFMKDAASFGADIILTSAKIGSNLEMQNSSFSAVINANSMNVAGSLFMGDHASFSGPINLTGANIGGSLEMIGSSFIKDISASRLSVGASLFMSDGATFAGEINLNGAKVGGNLEMEGSSFAGRLDANSLMVVRNLFMRDHASFGGEVSLIGAKVGGTLDMDGSSFAKAVNADSLSVDGSLFMRNHAAFGGEVTLTGAKIASNLEMQTSSFAGRVGASSLNVERNLWMLATFRGDVDLTGARVGGILDLRSAAARRLNLSGIDARELVIAGLAWCCADNPVAGAAAAAPAGGMSSVHWPLGARVPRKTKCETAGSTTSPMMIMRNAHTGALQDSADAWPPSLDLEGFHYDRLGGLGGTGRNDMRMRSPEEWEDWLARDCTFSTQPYAQLSSVLVAAGHRDAAEAIQYAGRERERGEAWVHSLPSWMWLSVFSVVAGYGIGLYTFRVLWWVIGLTVVGALLLQFSPQARRRGFVWRLGASLHRLLPVVELSKEFKDFFENPPAENEPRNLNRFLTAYFAVHAVAGWILGFFLLAAMGGLTQKG